MSLEIFAALLVFALATSVTPGPNNLMLLTSAVNFGFGRTLPHMAGVTIGLSCCWSRSAPAWGASLPRFPGSIRRSRSPAASICLYLAWRIATSRTLDDGEAGSKPLGFLQAFAFQWVNPKGWVMAVTAMGAYADPGDLLAHDGDRRRRSSA